MKCNVGKADRAVRLVVGSIILIIGIVFHSWWSAMGVVLLLTGLFKWCPLYSPLSINTVDDPQDSDPGS